MTRKAAARLLALVAFVAVAVVVLTPFTNIAHIASAINEGDGRVQAWVLGWVAHAITTGQPLFDANMFFPSPQGLAHTDHMAALGALAVPIWLATGNAVLAFNILQIAGPALAAWGTFVLARDWTGDGAAAAVSGVAFGFSSFVFLHNGHLNLTWLAGIPLGLLALDRWWDQPTWTRFGALWVAAIFTALVSWYLALMFALVLGAYLAALVLARRGVLHLDPRAWQVVAGIALGVAVLLPFVAPYLGRGAEAGEAAAFATDLRSYLVPSDVTWLGGLLHARGWTEARGIWGERTQFLGWLALVLTLAGLVAGLRGGGAPLPRWRAVFLAATGAAGLLLSFGPSPAGWSLFDLLATLPGVGGFRATARFGVLVSFSVAMLAGAGAAMLWRGRPRRTRVLLSGVVCLVMLAEVFVAHFPAPRPAPFPMHPMYARAAADGASAAVALPMYAGQSIWFLEGDYLLFSTQGDFLPLANGIGRWVPRTYVAIDQATRDFPSPAAAAVLRDFGITHVLFHGARFADAGARRARAAEGRDFVEVFADGADVLFRVTDP